MLPIFYIYCGDCGLVSYTKTSLDALDRNSFPALFQTRKYFNQKHSLSALTDNCVFFVSVNTGLKIKTQYVTRDTKNYQAKKITA